MPKEGNEKLDEKKQDNSFNIQPALFRMIQQWYTRQKKKNKL